jgi:16S rRNA (adenine1518-N6/adenine1519-N6)-dimethyltransferase
MGKRLGQHFLINKDKIRKIVESLELKNGDVIIEIGPGHGELTDELKVKSLKLKVIAIEKDRELYEKLANSNWKLDKNIKFIYGDILKILPELITNYQLQITNYKIVGNIPYYITGYLLRILGELENKPSLIVLTIQKEVAERVCAFRQSYEVRLRKIEKMNLLAASVQFWAEPEIIGYISKKDFQPAPEVDSAIVKLKVKSKKLKVRPENYYKFIKILFKQPRKTILNNILSGIMNNELRIMNKEKIIEKLREVGVSPNARPQDLNIEQIKELLTLF